MANGKWSAKIAALFPLSFVDSFGGEGTLPSYSSPWLEKKMMQFPLCLATYFFRFLKPHLLGFVSRTRLETVQTTKQ